MKKTLELFSGTKSFSKMAGYWGYETFTVDNHPLLKPDLLANILYLDVNQLPYHPDILWASPPCTAFSVASIGTHWTGGKKGYIPKTEEAKLGIRLVAKTFELIDELSPEYWFVENPRGLLRKMPFMEQFEKYRHTITYCQYGDDRMKPTDIWTNLDWKPRPMCKNGDKCHQSAPRGSKTGTQGLKNATDRGSIPLELFSELFETITN